MSSILTLQSGPTYTFTTPAYQTAARTADIISHTFELFPTSSLHSENASEAILSCCIRYLPVALANPDGYRPRPTVGFNRWPSTA